MPLRALRDRLELIRYYSANRPASAWGRALDVAVVAALVAAWPTTWVLDRVYISDRTVETITGQIYLDPTGELWAWAPPPDRPPDDLRGASEFHGAWEVTLRREDHGFPFVTSMGPRAAAINVELFGENRRLAAEDLVDGSRERRALERALVDAERSSAVQALWDGGPGAVTHRVRGWIANGIAWSLALSILAWLLVSLARIAWLFVQVGRTVRAQRRRGVLQCTTCGYDLRASLFSERCPECGAPL